MSELESVSTEEMLDDTERGGEVFRELFNDAEVASTKGRVDRGSTN